MLCSVHVFRFEDEFLAACVKEPTIIAPIFYLDPSTAGGSAFHDDSYVVDDNDPDAAFAAAVAVSRPPTETHVDVLLEMNDKAEMSEAIARRIKNIVKIFEAADDDDSGAIDSDELWGVLQDPGFKDSILGKTFNAAPKEFFVFLFDKLDDDGNGATSMLDPFSRFSPLYAISHAPCDVPYDLLMLIGC